MIKYQHIIFELLLIFSAVLVFRSLWTIMDHIPVLNKIYAHSILLLAGILLSMFALYKLTNTD